MSIRLRPFLPFKEPRVVDFYVISGDNQVLREVFKASFREGRHCPIPRRTVLMGEYTHIPTTLVCVGVDHFCNKFVSISFKLFLAINGAII